MKRWVAVSIAMVAIVLVLCALLVMYVQELDAADPEMLNEYIAGIVEYGIPGVFLLTVISGTVLPLGTPAIIAIAGAAGIPRISLVVVAAAGFTIGCGINYILAYWLGEPFIKKRYEEQYYHIKELWDKWGTPIFVFFCFVPLMPVDLFALFCGLYKMKPSFFVTVSFTGRLVAFTFWSYIGVEVADVVIKNATAVV
ncbi:MAG: VTT domain-containing protein [Halobacteriota archaeon]|nr:VTT domain-containing protein [Halobacteriota archaeon]